MDLTAFRAAFPEFADAIAFSDETITFWTGIAEKLLLPDRWADMLNHVVMLCTAHYLTIATSNTVSNGSGSGLVASESAGDVSVSYDTSNTAEEGAGNWNESNYGRQFIRLARMFGSGGVQV